MNRCEEDWYASDNNDNCGMLRRLSIPQLSHHDVNIHNNILTDQYNGFVTLKDFELPDDGFD